MTEQVEEKIEVKKEDRPSFLKEAKAEREALEKVRDEIKAEREKFEQLRAEDIMSGRVPVSKNNEKKPEISPQDYATAALKGQTLK